MLGFIGLYWRSLPQQDQERLFVSLLDVLSAWEIDRVIELAQEEKRRRQGDYSQPLPQKLIS